MLGKAEAGAELAAIEDMVARVKQSRIYRVAANVMVLWGVVQLAQYVVLNLAGAAFEWIWIPVDGVGVLGTLYLLSRVRGGNPVTVWRMLATYVLFYGFGFVWSAVLGQLHGPAVAVFWHTLFLFGMSVAGVWFGYGFLVLGLTLSLAILADYAFAGPLFWPILAGVTGAGYIFCGLWMQRA